MISKVEEYDFKSDTDILAITVDKATKGDINLDGYISLKDLLLLKISLLGGH